MSGTLDNETSWLPVGETEGAVYEDGVSLVSTTTLCGVAYGIAFTLFIICAQSLLQEIRAGFRKRQATWSLIYMSIMIVMGTIYCALSARATQLQYVNFRNFPGGPSAYSLYIFDTPLDITADSAFVITGVMNDALLLWRLTIVYRASRFYRSVVIGGGILYLAIFVLGLMTLIESSLPHHSLWSPLAIKYASAYYGLVTLYTVIVTTIMVVRILSVRRNFMKATGTSECDAQYLSVAAMIVESSALYTIWGIIFLVLFVVDSPIVDVFVATLSEVQIIAPLLIMYRVSQGKAWERDMDVSLTTFEASAGPRFRNDHTTTTDTILSSHDPGSSVDKEAHSVPESKETPGSGEMADEYELQTV